MFRKLKRNMRNAGRTFKKVARKVIRSPLTEIALGFVPGGTVIKSVFKTGNTMLKTVKSLQSSIGIPKATNYSNRSVAVSPTPSAKTISKLMKGYKERTIRIFGKKGRV